MRMRRSGIPWVMAIGRAVAGPVLVLGARCGWNGVVLAGLVLGALLSDVFDGVLARRWRCDTAELRLSDSLADLVFYLCTTSVLLRAGLLRGNVTLLAVVVEFEALRLGFDCWKFGRMASYHSYLAKGWGLVLALAVMAALAWGNGGVLLRFALIVGVLCELEGLVMSVVLPQWRRDVAWVGAAWRMREEMTGRGRRLRALPVVAALVMLTVSICSAGAVEPGTIEYRGGTLTAIEVGCEGRVDLASSTVLVMRFAGGGAGREVTIPYGSISGWRYVRQAKHHLGVLPAIAVGLVAARQHRDTFFIHFSDGQGAVQVVEFDVAARDRAALGEVLRVRVPKPGAR